jgi:hypothetical protein
MVEVVMPKKIHNNLKPRSVGWLMVTTVPQFWKPIVEAKVEDANLDGYAQWLRQLVRREIKAELTAMGRGDVDLAAGGVMVTHESARDGAEVVDMKVGISDDPLENVAKNFLDIPGKD